MKFPTIDEFAKRVAEKALDEITYEGKTIREWAGIITKQQPSEDCISRSEALKHTHIEYDDDGVGHKVVNAEDIKDLPPVTPKQKVGKWILKHRKNNSMKWLTGTDEYGVEHTVKKYEEYECDEPYCSECGRLAGDTSQNYCAYCGSYNGGENNEHGI